LSQINIVSLISWAHGLWFKTSWRRRRRDCIEKLRC